MTLLVVVLAVRPYCRCAGPDVADRTERRCRSSRPDARAPAVSISGHYATRWSTWIGIWLSCRRPAIAGSQKLLPTTEPMATRIDDQLRPESVITLHRIA